MVVIGQIISLFGNAILTYALPLYLLNVTHSPSLFGSVSACALIPLLFFTPFGGVIADRVNKRNIMVILDFATAAIMLIYYLMIDSSSIVVPIIIVLMLLYAIQGLYSPSVQASIPLLSSPENRNSAIAIINMVQSLASLIGPVIGGLVYAKFGIKPVVIVSVICFFASAVLEIFIKIPHKKIDDEKNGFRIVINDMKDGLRFMLKEKPFVKNIALICCLLNFAFVALSSIGVPVIVTEVLDFDAETANTLFAYCEGFMAAGGFLGGIIMSVFGSKFHFNKSYITMLVCVLCTIPIALAVELDMPPMVSFVIIALTGFIISLCCTIISVQLISFQQSVVPVEFLGKISAIASCLSLCAVPIGKWLFGNLFEIFSSQLYIVIGIAGMLLLIATIWLKNLLKNV